MVRLMIGFCVVFGCFYVAFDFGFARLAATDKPLCSLSRLIIRG